MILDDYELLYQKFANTDEKGIIDSNNDDDNTPYFFLKINDKEKSLFSAIEDEKILIIEKPVEKEKGKEEEKKSENPEKKKYFKIEKKPKRKLIKRVKKNLITKRKRRSFIKYNKKIYTSTKYFPFTKGRGIIYHSNQDSDSLSYRIEIPISYVSVSDFSDSERNDFSNEKNRKNNKKEKMKNRKIKNKKKEYTDDRTYDELSNNTSENITKLSNNLLYKFKIRRYFIDENGKRKKIKKKRKFKPDDIRKKIKCRFHKAFKNIINENLKKAGSKELFDYLPQCFVGNISKKLNSKCLDLTYKELLSTNFLVELNKENYPNSKIDLNKIKKNLKVLNYLEKNPEISKRSGFDLIKDRKYRDILNIYFSSYQFENSLLQLKNENESPEYIQEYYNYSKNFTNFYSTKEIGQNDNEKEKDSEKEKESEKESENEEEDEK